MTQISQTTPNPPIQVSDTDTLKLRGWYTSTFVAADGVTPVLGWDGQVDGFYYDVDCSVNDDGFLVIPAFDVQPTTESSPTAGFFGQLYINGAPRQMIFGNSNATAGWQIPTIYGDVITYDELARYNAAATLVYPPITFPTFTQMIAEIRRLAAGVQTYAGVGLLGLTQLDTAPADPALPVAIGANNPNIGNVIASLTPNTVPRASSDVSLSDGLPTDDGVDWGIQTLNYVQLGDYNVESGGTRFAINDTFALFQLLAAREGGVEYAGVIANAASGMPVVEIQSTGLVKLVELPTTDPAIANALWRDGNDVKISTG